MLHSRWLSLGQAMQMWPFKCQNDLLQNYHASALFFFFFYLLFTFLPFYFGGEGERTYVTL